MNLATSPWTFGIQAFITLAVIMDPPGATPIFLSLVGDRSAKVRKKLALQAALVSFFVIVLFAIFGKLILSSLHISIFGLQGAGGLLLLLVSLQLLMGWGENTVEGKDENLALVPLGTPLLAGPGAIVTTMIYVDKASTISMKFSLGLAIVAIHIFVALSLLSSELIIRLVKESGVRLLARIAGLLLAAIAFDMVIQSIKGFFHLA
jgi:multiple antibiotic resistance protein